MRRMFIVLGAVALTASIVAVAPVTAAVPSRDVTVHFLLDEPDGGPFLVPVHRSVDADGSLIRAAMVELLSGPTALESAASPALSTAIPAATELRDVGVVDGVARVDLSSEYAAGGGSFTMMARLAQVVYTLTRFDAVDGVVFLVEGVPVSTFSSEGIVLDSPVDRGFFDGSGVVPPIFVDVPARDDVFHARVAGTTTVADGTFRVAVADQNGSVLAEEVVTATGGVFETFVRYQVASAQPGTVTVWDDAPDGGRQLERVTPVTLSVLGVGWQRGLDFVCPGAVDAPFTDVSPSSPHARSIACMWQWQVANGTSATTFSPALTATRAQIAAFVARGVEASGGVLPATVQARFSDVADSPHRLRIEQLAQVGILAGYGDGTFGPERLMTREQLAQTLYRAYQYRAQVQLRDGADWFVDDDGREHERAVNALAECGVVAGTGDGQFSPLRSVTREQTMTMLAQWMDLLGERSFLDASMT